MSYYLIPVILADLEINLDEFSGLEPQKLDYMCFRLKNKSWSMDRHKININICFHMIV